MGAPPPNPRDFAALPPGLLGGGSELSSHPLNPGRWVGARGASPQSPILRPGCNSISRLTVNRCITVP
jgi:hypothetical protein